VIPQGIPPREIIEGGRLDAAFKYCHYAMKGVETAM
jgi:hypothetical protein